MTQLFYETIEMAQLHEQGRLAMSYMDTWVGRRSAFPVSLTMPLQADAHGDEKLLPWLANLLPESHLSEIGQQLKVSPQDVLGLLKHIGRDTAGALSFGLAREVGTHVLHIPDEKSFEKILDDLPEKPFLVGNRGVSMSLAGVQEKLPVYIGPDGRIGIPVNGTPSTHIVKPDAHAKRLKSSVQNEAFCMRLARNCGLDVAEVTTGRAGKRTYLLVKRYDRVPDSTGTIRRIHQEDFCQLLGYFPSQKYERSRFGGRDGPGLKQMFGAVGDHVSLGERQKLLDAVVFNVLCCNTDSHAKNYSILIGQGGRARLAPLYDLMCASVYPHVDQTMAQAIAGRINPDHLNGADWQKLARDVGLSPASTLRRVAELARLVIDNVDLTVRQVTDMPAGGTDMLVKVAHLVKKRAKRIGRQMADGTAAKPGEGDHPRPGPRP